MTYLIQGHGKLLRALLLLLLGAASTMLQADPATIQGNRLVVPRIDFDDLGAVEIRFAIDTGDGISLVTDSWTDATPGTEATGVFDADTGTLEIFEILLPNGKSFYARLEMASPDEPDHFLLREVQRLENAVEQDSGDHSAQGDFFDSNCASCHGSTGLGTSVAPSLISCANCTSFTQLRDYIRDTMPLGNAGACDAACAGEMADFILAVLNAPTKTIKSIDGIILMSETEVLRKAALQLVSRLPTAAELAMLDDDPQHGLSRAIDNMMEEEPFLDRVAEIFNLYLLTDKYLSSNSSEGAVRLLNRDDYPNARWFDPEDQERQENYEIIRNTTNNSVAREPLELIKHVVREDRPMSEILTADYIMLNPFSAKSYGVEVTFNDANDYTEFREAKLPGIPTAGILTSTMFLNRYPTTFTNRNRGRARVVYDYFLDTDILAIEGTRPGNAVDITNAVPTVDNPECYKCHSVLDPVASIFQNWNEHGAYRPARLSKYGWFTDMEQRGFNGKTMPLQGNIDSSVQWLAGEIVKDPRFARAMVRIMVRGLTGKEPLLAPGEGAPAALQDAWLSERSVLTGIQQAFVADNMNLKTLVREVVLSPYWQAQGLTSAADSAVHTETGAKSLLGPEQLHKKLRAVTGIEWRGNLDAYHKHIDSDWEARLLNGRRYFQQIYGGINSDSVIKPLTEPNGLMGAVQFRMANEMACYVVPNEFLNQKLGAEENNLLFPYVTMDTLPRNEDGSTNSDGMQRIRQNIRYLHALLLGEELAADDAELGYTADLFLEVLAEGQAGIAAAEKEWEVVRLPQACKRHYDLVTGEDLRQEGGPNNSLQEDPDYVIRSWMAVVAYMLADYRFVYE